MPNPSWQDDVKRSDPTYLNRRVPHISILRCGHRPKDDRTPPPTSARIDTPDKIEEEKEE
jgi:hypothetical protein